MSNIDPDQLIRLARELHGYTLGAAGGTRTAEMLAGVAAALTALAPETQFHEEPAAFAAVLSALAPEDE